MTTEETTERQTAWEKVTISRVIRNQERLECDVRVWEENVAKTKAFFDRKAALYAWLRECFKIGFDVNRLARARDVYEFDVTTAYTDENAPEDLIRRIASIPLADIPVHGWGRDYLQLIPRTPERAIDEDDREAVLYLLSNWRDLPSLVSGKPCAAPVDVEPDEDPFEDEPW